MNARMMRAAQQRAKAGINSKLKYPLNHSFTLPAHGILIVDVNREPQQSLDTIIGTVT